MPIGSRCDFNERQLPLEHCCCCCCCILKVWDKMCIIVCSRKNSWFAACLLYKSRTRNKNCNYEIVVEKICRLRKFSQFFSTFFSARVNWSRKFWLTKLIFLVFPLVDSENFINRSLWRCFFFIKFQCAAENIVAFCCSRKKNTTECLSPKSFSHICMARYHFLPPTEKKNRIMQIDGSLIKHHHTCEMFVTWIGCLMLPVSSRMCKQELNRMSNCFFHFNFISPIRCKVCHSSERKVQTANGTQNHKENFFQARRFRFSITSFFRVFCLTSALDSRKCVFN